MPSLQSKITSKGQITLPKQIRKRLAITTGDRMEFSLEKSNQVTMRKKKAPGSSAGCGRRFISPVSRKASVEEMDEGIRQAVISKWGQLKGPGK